MAYVVMAYVVMAYVVMARWAVLTTATILVIVPGRFAGLKLSTWSTKYWLRSSPSPCPCIRPSLSSCVYVYGLYSYGHRYLLAYTVMAYIVMAIAIFLHIQLWPIYLWPSLSSLHARMRSGGRAGVDACVCALRMGVSSSDGMVHSGAWTCVWACAWVFSCAIHARARIHAHAHACARTRTRMRARMHARTAMMAVVALRGPMVEPLSC